jgi:hypothetical protein
MYVVSSHAARTAHVGETAEREKPLVHSRARTRLTARSLGIAVSTPYENVKRRGL